MRKPTIIVVIGDETLLRHVEGLLLCDHWEIVTTSDITAIPRLVRHAHPALVIVELTQERASHGLEVAQQLCAGGRSLPMILLVPQSSEDIAIAALKAGVYDYFKVPFAGAALVASVRRCLADAPSHPLPAPSAPAIPVPPYKVSMIGDSLTMQQIKAYMARIAVTDCNVLITGETGTGKEVVAALIHHCSPRCQKPLISLNCAALPDNLLESELFGYERGAFTGAHTTKAGLLQLANGGTVFLDEIGDMSPYAQAKILRAIDNREIQRLGGKHSIPLDIRVIAATHQNLQWRASTGTFRQDLYFRLNVARVHLPPLRERQEDIPALLAHYVREANHRFGRQVEGFSAAALAQLSRYAWPGNVRELKNLVEASFVNLPMQHVAVIDLPEMFCQQCGAADDLPQDERHRLLDALFATQWNKSKAAQQLHWSRMTVYRKMAKYHIAPAAQ